MITGAKSLVRSLEHHGVEFVFGMPGAENLELVDSLVDSSIRQILVTSEVSASFMADGYARASGKVGVCTSISGPGLTYMLTGVAEAFLDSSPLVLLVTRKEEDDKAFHIHQIEQREVASPVVKGVLTITDGAEIPRAVGEAFRLAQEGEPGPVLVEIAAEVLRTRTDHRPHREAEKSGASPGPEETIEQIGQMVRDAELCGIYAGKGALSASVQIERLAELLSAPVATTISGKGVIPEDHELAVGFGFGPAGTKIAEDVFGRCDLVLALGCKFGEMSTGNWSMDVPAKLVHIDTNSDVFHRNYTAAVTLCRDVETATRELLEDLRDIKRPRNAKLVQEIRREKENRISEGRESRVSQGIHPLRLIHQLRDALARGAILATDCGNHQLWAITDYRVFEPRTFLTPSDYMAMGFGVPAAIGAAIGKPDRKVVCICGDGGFLISGFELLTAVREQLDLAVVIFNDGALGLIKGSQQRVYGRTASVDILNPDYKSLSDALGIDYLEIQADEDLADGLREMEARKGVALVNVRVEYDESSKTQMGMAKASWQRLSFSSKLSLIGRRAGRMLKTRTRGVN